MKQIEITTSKGRFLVSESDEHYDYRFIGLLSRITEEQASEIVDFFTEYSKRFQDYERLECAYLTAIESLHSLLKSKGIHLFENPVPEPEYQFDNFGNGGMCESWINAYQEAEQKTFYNPYIFKIK